MVSVIVPADNPTLVQAEKIKTANTERPLFVIPSDSGHRHAITANAIANSKRDSNEIAPKPTVCPEH